MGVQSVVRTLTIFMILILVIANWYFHISSVVRNIVRFFGFGKQHVEIGRILHVMRSRKVQLLLLLWLWWLDEKLFDAVLMVAGNGHFNPIDDVGARADGSRLDGWAAEAAVSGGGLCEDSGGSEGGDEPG